MMKLSTTDPTTPKKHQRTLSAADVLTSPLTSAVSTTLASPAAAVRSFFLASPSQQQLQAEKEKEIGTGSIQNSCYNYFYYNQAEENNSNHGGGGGSSSHAGNINSNNSSMHNNNPTMEQRIQNQRLPLQDCRRVLEDEEQFAKLQQRLRDASCQTNGPLKQCWTDLLRERTDDAKRLAYQKQAQQRAHDQALASQLDQVNLENEISAASTTTPTTTTTSSFSSPKGVMDFKNSSSSSSSSSTAAVPKKPSPSSKTAVSAAAMMNAVKAPPFGMEEEDSSESSSSDHSSNHHKSVKFQ